jgi:uncharacterized protein (UPF0276 family)
MSVAKTARQFEQRVAEIPYHGIGLSVDLYTPDLAELQATLEREGIRYGYLEIFKASQRVLAELREKWPGLPLAYHAEGLWVTEPQLLEAYAVEREFELALSQLKAIQAQWLTHECATKQMAGYSFGTYLPPLFTAASAAVTARNIRQIQQWLDARAKTEAPARHGPLFLLETPPLTYFGCGDLVIADFFTAVTDQAACGIVLDIGHVWTVYRYTGAWRSQLLEDFLAEFLDRFPLQRVVQIHLAGLGLHPATSRGTLDGIGSAGGALPFWIDAHADPIPKVLFDMLEQVLSHPGLLHLRGVALEVDNKPIPTIVEEMKVFSQRVGQMIRDRSAAMDKELSQAPIVRCEDEPNDDLQDLRQEQLLLQYERYAKMVTGQSEEAPCLQWVDPEGLAIYRKAYLPYEILQWGGDLRDMFPESCRRLDRAAIPLGPFVDFWFSEPHDAQNDQEGYDFFLLKAARFAAYVSSILPDAADLAHREAAVLRQDYALACG